MMAMTREIKRLGRQVSALGIGCWAIGGLNYGVVDDNESVRGIRRALDLGVTILDTSDFYGYGHSERVVGKALEGRRQEVTVATKFGYSFDEENRVSLGERSDKEYVEQALDASLRRLNTDYIDLYQLHIGGLKGEAVDGILDELDRQVQKGKIRSYGWSTDDAENAARFAVNKNCSVIQFQLNLFYDNPELIKVCNDYGVAGIIRGPLAMGALTGKYSTGLRIDSDDVRGQNIEWVPYFKDGKLTPEFTKKMDAVREILTSGGRTLSQGALAWVWAKCDKAIPIPGFRTVKQVEENVGAMAFGPLTPAQMSEIHSLVPPLSWKQF